MLLCFQQSASGPIMATTDGHYEAFLLNTAREYATILSWQYRPSSPMYHCLWSYSGVEGILTHVLGGQLLFLKIGNPGNHQGPWTLRILLQGQQYDLYWVQLRKSCDNTEVSESESCAMIRPSKAWHPPLWLCQHDSLSASRLFPAQDTPCIDNNSCNPYNWPLVL